MAYIKCCANMDMLHCRDQRTEIQEELTRMIEEERRLLNTPNIGWDLIIKSWWDKFLRFFK